jgi:hypothetical protein
MCRVLVDQIEALAELNSIASCPCATVQRAKGTAESRGWLSDLLTRAVQDTDAASREMLVLGPAQGD